MPVPIITVAQMREWEKATWASGQTEEAVMQKAGEAVARYVETLTQPQDFILILAGKGHNGEDAAYAAKSLRRGNELIRVVDPERTLKGFDQLLARKPAVVVDGLFGIGLNRPLAAPWTRLIQRINESHVPVVAVDVPSGLNADTGLPLEQAVRATTTVTMGAVKVGLLTSSAWPFVGRIEVADDIGLIPYPFSTEINWTVANDFDGFPPRRPQAGHKGTFGHVVLIAGSLGYHGASVLAARGAQRAQPGLITLITAPDVYQPVASQCQAVMVRPWSDELALPDTCTAIVVGPGLAAPNIPEDIKAFVSNSWKKSSLAMVVDASALGWLPQGPCPADALRVITPHPGEAARLLGVNTVEVQNDRPRAARKLSQRFGDCYVVLKGHQTLIGRSKTELFVNSSGNPLLGQGGTGDLLAGYLGGLLAQPGLQEDPLRTLRFGVWQHGAAADYLSATRPNWIVENLAEVLGTASARPVST